jgi:hypothetical protein
MISNLFFSNNNKNSIKSIIYEESQLNVDDKIITETMNYVYSQVSSTPPKGVDPKEYLFLMNKKVYSIVLPILKETKKSNPNLNSNVNNTIIESKKIVKKGIKNENNTSKSIMTNTVFDDLLIRNYETPNIIDYPKPSISDKFTNENSSNHIKSIENERSTLIPKLKPVDLTLKNDNAELPDTLSLYNKILTDYEDSILPSNDSTPINILNNINSINVNAIDSNNGSDNNLIEQFSNIESGSRFDNSNEYNSNSIKNNNQSDIFKQSLNSVNSRENILFKEPEYKLIEKKFYIIFDSSDRDLYKYPNPSSFQVKFSPIGNSLKYGSYYDDLGTLILKEKTVVYGDSANLSVQETFDNINSIAVKSVNVPVNLIYLGTTEPQNEIHSLSNSLCVNNIYKESYVYLVIPELRGPYRGGNLLAYNAFAKLLIDYSSIAYVDKAKNFISYNFTTLMTSDKNECFMYEPISAGKIDKLTLNLVNKAGNIYNFGIDKLYIKGFGEGSMKYNGYCGDKFMTTKFIIQNVNDEYKKYCELYYNGITSCNTLNSHSVNEGDLLYFYDTLPNSEQVIYLENYVKINKIKFNKKYNKYEISVSYPKIIDGEENDVFINFKYLIPEANFNNYYIVLHNTSTNTNYFFKIFDFTDSSVIIDDTIPMPKFKNYSMMRVGVVKPNLRGINNDDRTSLFYKGGYNVIGTGSTSDNLWEIEVNFPYNNLPAYLKDTSLYIPGGLFLIQEKLQISYTFTVTVKTKDYQMVSSQLNESGNN